ncbi:hypothetical protein AJ87_01720 [Rhizobium yanglingense]|nr:hypothetical protein AJ87_01720 [Rhizobium yanglingense]
MYQSPHFREDDLATEHQLIRAHPWVVDAPEDFIRAQLKGIIGVELEIAAIEGKWKVSQNRPVAGREAWRQASAGRLVRPRCWIL